ncbi:hypothetical protein GBAR_LOCUS9386 [Geodia barretti]|uniref:DUF11 domain-containing protein n=1 Tax=Geodia barretti TaxID=519541 RepID=A0AA35RRL6_GEOBA|nr:hypothetical protein GBAR_LOCUS9386 [Geodia barretti]
MSLIQRTAIPIIVLLAVVGVGVAIFTASSPFASGQETDSCDTGVGIGIKTRNESGQNVASVRHGDVINYGVTLSLLEPEPGTTYCNFGGGTLTITLPSGDEVVVAGSEDTPAIETVSTGNPFFSTTVNYAVNQNDGVQSNPDDLENDNVELTVRARYSGGHTVSSTGTLLGAEVEASGSNLVRMVAPSVDIVISPSVVQDAAVPDSQTVYQGQVASFNVVITNTGGFELSNIAVASLEDAEAGEVSIADCARAADSFEALAVGSSTAAYTCGTTTETSFVQRVQVTADGTATDTAGGAIAIQVSNDDTTTVFYGTVAVGITITAQSPVVRLEQNGTFDITVTTPTATGLDNVTVAVRIDGPGEGQSTDSVDCSKSYQTVAADAEVEPYACSEAMFQGINTITATVSGTVPGTETVLQATDSTQVEAITPGLSIAITPGEQTIRSGATAQLTFTITNGASDLTGVTVIDPDPSNTIGLDLQICDTALDAIGDLAANQEISIICTTAILAEETSYEAVAVGTASDNSTEPSDTANALVKILSPSTAIGLAYEESDTQIIRLVVQTLKVTETNDGDSPLSDVTVTMDPTGVVLTRDSKQYVSGDANNDAILDPGETWEWRVVTVAVAGDVVLLPANAETLFISATGYGVDQLGGEVTIPGDVDEYGEVNIPIVAN